jgi:hypothetical protein
MSPKSAGFVSIYTCYLPQNHGAGENDAPLDKQNDCLLGKRRKRIWTCIYEMPLCMELFAKLYTIKPRIVDVRVNVKKKKVSDKTL